MVPVECIALIGRELEDITPSFVTPVATIYAGYTRIVATKRRGDPPIPAQLHAQFGITEWEWPRLKLVYEKALTGAPYATALVADVDAGRLSISAAHNELKKQEKIDAQAATGPSSVRLPVVYERILRTHAFAETTATALKQDVPVTTGELSGDDITECIRLMRATSLHLKHAADALSRSRLSRS
jgi:hypothetical protein